MRLELSLKFIYTTVKLALHIATKLYTLHVILECSTVKLEHVSIKLSSSIQQAKQLDFD